MQKLNCREIELVSGGGYVTGALGVAAGVASAGLAGGISAFAGGWEIGSTFYENNSVAIADFVDGFVEGYTQK